MADKKNNGVVDKAEMAVIDEQSIESSTCHHKNFINFCSRILTGVLFWNTIRKIVYIC